MKPYRIFSISSAQTFEEAALALFHDQAENCLLYKRFLAGLSVEPKEIKEVAQIPFLPIEFFKTHRVMRNDMPEDLVFYSSGTGGTFTSKHYVADRAIYEQSYRTAFNHFYGPMEQYA